MKHLLATATLCVVVISQLTACADVLLNPQVPNAQSVPELFQVPAEDEYRIQKGDTLTISSYYDTQLNQEALVRRDGRISLLLLKDVSVVGQTPNDISAMLSEQYAKYVQGADVNVAVVQSMGLSIYVGGEVKRSSQQPLDGPLTVVQAITAAGGFLSTANVNQVLVLRRQDDGGFVVYQLDVNKVLINEARDVYLQRFDIVHVPMSPIAHLGKFVDQYINNIIPEALGFTGAYTFIREVNKDNSPVEFKVVNP